MSEPTRDGLLSEGFRAGFDEAALDAYGVAREHVPFEDTDEANEAREEALAMFLKHRRAQDTRPSAGELRLRLAVGMLHEAIEIAERNGNEPGMSPTIDQWRAFVEAAVGEPSAGAGVGEAQPSKWKCGGCGHGPHGGVCLGGEGDVCRCAGQPEQDVACEHGTACDVHCCNCHSGFVFDHTRCVCGSTPAPAPVREPAKVNKMRPTEHAILPCENCGEPTGNPFAACVRCGQMPSHRLARIGPEREPTPPPPAIDVEQLARELFDGLVDPKDNRSVKQTFADTIRAALRRLSPEPK